MAELDFLLTDSARERLLRWTLEQGAVLVPNTHFHEPDYEEIRTVAKLERFSSETLFFVLRDDWQVERLVLKPYTNRYKGSGFYIAQRYGGPALTYVVYPQREEGGRAILGRGSIMHYPFYYSGADSRQLEPGDSLKSFYREATRFMKDGALQLKGHKQSVWVAREGVSLLSSNRISAPEPWDKARKG